MKNIYYTFHYKGVEFGCSSSDKLIIVKLQNITDSFQFKEQNADNVYRNKPTEYKKINNEFVGYNINSKENKEFLDPKTFKIIDNAKLADFYKKKVHKVKDNLNHYVISYLIFDKYNTRFKYYIHKLTKDSIFFGHQKINTLLLKLADSCNKTINTKNIFTMEECELLYNFLDFLYFHCSDEQIFDTTDYRNNTKLYTQKQYCEKINTLFNAYLEKLKAPHSENTPLHFNHIYNNDNALYIKQQTLYFTLLTKENKDKQSKYNSLHGHTYNYNYNMISKQHMHFISNFNFENEKNISNIHHYLSKIYASKQNIPHLTSIGPYRKENYFIKETIKPVKEVNAINDKAITFILDNKSFNSKTNFIISNIYNDDYNDVFKYNYTYDICENDSKTDIIYLIDLKIYMKTSIFNTLFLHDNKVHTSFDALYDKYYKYIYLDDYYNKQYYLDDKGVRVNDIIKIDDEQIVLSNTHIHSKIKESHDIINISIGWITFFNSKLYTIDYLKNSVFYELFFKLFEEQQNMLQKKRRKDSHYEYDYDNYNRSVIMNKTDLEYFKSFISNKLDDDMYLKFKLNTTTKQFNIEPFEYQQKNAYWMGNIENKIHNDNSSHFDYICNPNYKFINLKNRLCIGGNNEPLYVFKSNIDLVKQSNYYDMKQNNLYDTGYIFKYDDEFKQKYVKTIKLSGGILSDDVGLGKTLSTIKHIINSIQTDTDTETDTTPYDVNNLIITPNRLVSQWYNEIKKYVTPALFKTLNIKKITTITDIKKSLYDTTYKKHHIYIISSNLINNANYLNYIINDEYDVKKYLDYVKNPTNPKKNYYNLITESVKTYEHLRALLNDDILTELEAYKIDNTKKFNIFKLKWNRIILDEAHEVLNTHILINTHFVDVERIDLRGYKNPNYMELKHGELTNGIKKPDRLKYSLLCRLVSNYKWCLTATPFKNNIYNLYSYINFLNNDYNANINKNRLLYDTYTENERILYFDIENLGNTNHNSNGYKNNGVENSLFGLNCDQLKCIFSDYIRKTSKSDIKGIVDIPIFTEEITFLKQNNIERNIYLEALRSNDTVRLLKLCTHIMVSNTHNENTKNAFTSVILTLEQIKTIMITKYKTENAKCLKELTKNTQESEDNAIVINSLKVLKETLKSLQFNDSTNINYIEKKSQNELDNFCSIESNSYKYGNSYKYSYYSPYHESIKTIKSILLIHESINKYSTSIDTLYDILSYIGFPKEFNNNAFKKYVGYRLYSNYLNNLTARNTSIIKMNEKQEFEIKRLHNQIKIFEDDSFISEAVKDPCSICFMDYDGEIALTTCRHMMCGDCIKLLFNRECSVPCPFCRTIISKKDINFTTCKKITKTDDADKKQTPASSKETDNEQKIQKYGTKLAYLLNYIGEIFKVKDNRIIIFSQYDYLLKLIGAVLNDFSIKNLFINGNIMSISKKIEKFKTDDSYRIIMLSSERCSSGSNLTEATHIIFADVINGDMNFTKDMESQAIGRAVRIGQKKPVVVKRIIMQDTIEEELFTKNRYDMLELQLQ